MGRILNYDPNMAATVANSISEFVKTDLGFEDMSEVIPGLVYAIALLAMETSDPSQVLDEVVDILSADPSVEGEVVEEEEG